MSATALATAPDRKAATQAASEPQTWRRACSLDDISPNTGVCALLDGKQVALVRAGDGEDVYGLSNFDPFSKAFVLSRGIVGDRAGVPKIASPMYKQSFDLRTGQCLDDPKVKVPSYSVRVREGWVEVLLPAASTADA